MVERYPLLKCGHHSTCVLAGGVEAAKAVPKTLFALLSKVHISLIQLNDLLLPITLYFFSFPPPLASKFSSHSSHHYCN